MALSNSDNCRKYQIVSPRNGLTFLQTVQYFLTLKDQVLWHFPPTFPIFQCLLDLFIHIFVSCQKIWILKPFTLTHLEKSIIFLENQRHWCVSAEAAVRRCFSKRFSEVLKNFATHYSVVWGSRSKKSFEVRRPNNFEVTLISNPKILECGSNIQYIFKLH